MVLGNRITSPGRFYRQHFRFDSGGPPTPPEPPAEPPAPPATEPRPRENLERELGRKNELLTKQQEQLDELLKFKDEQEVIVQKARDADLAAKGEYETLAGEKDARITELEAQVAKAAKADKARADAITAKLEEAIGKRTDADEMRGKLIHLVGDDPHRQWDLFQELTGNAAGGGTAPSTQTPNTGGGAGNGPAALEQWELDKCRDTCVASGRTFEEQCKWLQEKKANLPANPWAAENAAAAAKHGGV